MATAHAINTSPGTDETARTRRMPTKGELFARRQLIARLRKEGCTNLQIAERLGWGNRDTRVGGEVRRMRELGWDVESRAHTGREEMARRKAAAAVFWEAGLSAVEIAYVLKISDSACDSMLYRMRAAGEIEPHRETPWRDGPVQAAIASMAARGDTYQEIADRLHKTPSGVSSTIYRVRRRVAPHLQPTAEVPPRFIPGEAEERHQVVWALARSGMLREEIAALCGYELRTVTKILSAERTRRRDEGEPESGLVVARPSKAKLSRRRLEAWELARSGLSREEIAEQCGYGPKWVEKIVREERQRREAAGESAENLMLPGFSAHTEARARRAEVWAMAQDGISREEIANHTGYTLSTVKGIINAERIRRRNAGEPEADLPLPIASDSVRIPDGFWTEENVEQLIALYQAGNTRPAIAETMGIRFGQVESRLHRLITEKRVDPRRQTFSLEQLKALHRDYWHSGLSLESWSRREGFSRAVMSRRFRKHELPMRPYRPGRPPARQADAVASSARARLSRRD
jgi:DNA-binding NarL/FixJ family response regulator